MKYITLILFILPILFSCSKDKENTPEPVKPITNQNNTISLVASVGSYWIYNWYEIDSTNTETLTSRRDSVYVVGDTLINGKIHAIYRGKYFGGSVRTNLLIDSSGYIVDNGYKLFTYSDFGTNYNFYCEVGNFYCRFETSFNSPIQKSVPAGNFDVIDAQVSFYMPDSSWFSACDSVWISHNFYDKNNGFEVSSQIGFINPLRTICRYFERRLVDYHIAP